MSRTRPAIASAFVCALVATTAPASAAPVGPGSLDPGFRVGVGFGSPYPPTAVLTIAEERSSGKVLVGGYFAAYRGLDAPGIARLNKHGKLDATFDPGEGPNGPVTAILSLRSGKVLVAGSFTQFDGQPAGNMVRLNSDGSVDTSYRVAGFNAEVTTLAELADGDVYAAGNFTFLGRARVPAGLVRLDPNGTLDEGFKAKRFSDGFPGQVQSVLPTRKGKLLVGGSFSTYAGQPRAGLVRLRSNGALDTSFRPGSGLGNLEFLPRQVYSLTAYRGGYLVAGGFPTYRGRQSSNMVAVKRSGALDRRFQVGEGFSGQVNAVSLQGKKVIAVGNFDTYQGEKANGIVRLRKDGKRDRNFKTGSGFYGSVSSSELRSDGTLLVGGFFSTYRSKPSRSLVGIVTR